MFGKVNCSLWLGFLAVLGCTGEITFERLPNEQQAVKAITNVNKTEKNVAVTPTPEASPAVMAPAGVGTSLLENNTLRITWSPVEGATSYRVYYSVGAEFDEDSAAEIAGITDTSYDLLGAEDGVAYQIKIVAISPSGEKSVMSSVVIAQTKPVLYVDLAQADDSGSGAIDQPKKTIAAALALVTSTPTIIRVKSNASSYGQISITGGSLEIYGGYSAASWSVRDSATHLTKITDARTVGNASYPPVAAVAVSGAATELLLDGFTIVGANVASAQKATGLLITDGSKVNILNNTINSGNTSAANNSGVYINGGKSTLESNTIPCVPTSSGGYGLQIAGSTAEVTVKKSGIKACANTLSASAAVMVSSAAVVNIESSVIDANQATGWMTGIIISTTNTTISLTNNFIYGGTSNGVSTITKGIEVIAFTSDLYIRNNTINAGTGQSSSVGISVNTVAPGYDSEIQNNIITAQGSANFCIQEASIGAALTKVSNNNLFGCSVLMYDRQSATNCTTATMVNNLSEGSGNISVVPTFLGALTPAGNWHLDPNSSPSAELVEGGINGDAAGWGYTNDSAGATRTATITRAPSNQDAEGWSLGAYEFD